MSSSPSPAASPPSPAASPPSTPPTPATTAKQIVSAIVLRAGFCGMPTNSREGCLNGRAQSTCRMGGHKAARETAAPPSSSAYSSAKCGRLRCSRTSPDRPWRLLLACGNPLLRPRPTCHIPHSCTAYTSCSAHRRSGWLLSCNLILRCAPKRLRA